MGAGSSAAEGAAETLGSVDERHDGLIIINAQGIIMSDGRICNPRWGC